jgi:hypothetical protein
MRFAPQIQAIISTAVLVLVPTAAQATMTFTNTQVDENGTGFGNRLTILSVQANESEFGSILWDGSNDVDSGNATAQSATRTVTELLTAGITQDNFVVIFNINEGGDSAPVLTLQDFSLVFTSKAGVELFRETYNAGAGLPLDQAGNGNGASGWRFNVTFDGNAAAAASFFADPDNRVGMEVLRTEAILDTKGGSESFYVVSTVPEPSSGALAALAAVAIHPVLRRRRA